MSSAVAPMSQVMMSKEEVEKKILDTETQPGRRGRNVCDIFTAAVYGLLGCPMCCCFCCGFCGKFPAAPMVPRDVKGDVAKMPSDQRSMFNAESHVLAMVLGCSPISWCSACMCCGGCGAAGPHSTAKVTTLFNARG